MVAPLGVGFWSRRTFQGARGDSRREKSREGSLESTSDLGPFRQAVSCSSELIKPVSPHPPPIGGERWGHAGVTPTERGVCSQPTLPHGLLGVLKASGDT